MLFTLVFALLSAICVLAKTPENRAFQRRNSGEVRWLGPSCQRVIVRFSRKKQQNVTGRAPADTPSWGAKTMLQGREHMPEHAVIATWPFGRTAVQTALKLLAADKPALDAALAGAQDVED